MGSHPMKGRQKQVGQKLLSLGSLRGVDVVIPLPAVGRKYVQGLALRNFADEAAQVREAELEQRSAREIHLVFSAEEPLPAALIDGGGNRIERAQPRVG